MSRSFTSEELQSRLAQYCRTGQYVDLPGITPGRLPHYRRLILNVVTENLESAFPIAHANMAPAQWTALVEEFFTNHSCRAWQVWGIAGELLNYVRNAALAERLGLPWLNDLLEVEWQEMRVYNIPDGKVEPFGPISDLLNQRLVLHPDLCLLQLRYPVHLYSPAVAAQKMGQYVVLLYRDPVALNVQFMDLALWPALLLEQLRGGQLSLADLLPEAELFFPQLQRGHLLSAGLDFLNQLRNRGILLGASV